MEFRLRGADGQYRWFLDHGVPIYSFGGEFLGYIGTSVDVTQRREDQEMLLRSERLAAIGEAMAGLSHESRNALQRSQSSRERIFDAFRTTKARGTGLGLAITRRLIEAHDGRISAGDSPDGGAEFSICLPRQLRAALPG
jgi:C4-dicarboxylate-specific signal transduction histidine kinase